MNKVIQAIVLLVGGVTTLSPLVGQTPPGDGPLWTKTLEHEIRWLMPAPFGLVIVATKDELQVVEGGTGELAWQLEEKELERGRVFIILDNVLIASDNELDLPGYSTLRAYGLLDGRERWMNKRTIIGQVMKIVPDYKRGAAVVVSSGDQLRRAKPHTYVCSINLQDGSGTWGRRLEKDAKLHDGRLAGYHRPLLQDDDLYVPYGGLQAIDAVTGETRWFQKYGVLEDDLPFSEADLIVGDDVVYATGRGRVRAFERTTGRRLWETRDYGVVSQLHLRGSTLIAGTGGQFLKPGGKGGFFRSLVTVGADVYGAEWLGEALETTDILLGKRGRLQTATKEPVGLVAFDAPTGTVLWQYRLAKGGVTNVIEVENTLFIADEQHLIAVSPDS